MAIDVSVQYNDGLLTGIILVWVLGRDLKLTREHLAVAPCRRLTQFLFH